MPEECGEMHPSFVNNKMVLLDNWPGRAARASVGAAQEFPGFLKGLKNREGGFNGAPRPRALHELKASAPAPGDDVGVARSDPLETCVDSTHTNTRARAQTDRQTDRQTHAMDRQSSWLVG